MDFDTIFQDAGLIDAEGKPTSAPNNGDALGPVDPDSLFNDLDIEGSPAPKEEVKVEQADTPFNAQEPQQRQVDPDQMRAQVATKINNDMNEALVYGLSLRDSEGRALYTRAQLEAQFAPTRAMLLSQAETEVVKVQLAPYARRAAAEMIAKEHNLKPADIINEPSIEAMHASARAIAKYGRDAKFESRKASGADTVESGRGMSAAASEAYEKLSATQKIAFGLRRGDR